MPRARRPRGAALDPLTWGVWLAAGTAVGLATGLLPGMHVNTLAAMAAFAPAAGPGLAIGLLAVGAAHAFVQALPGTYLGAPSAEDGLAALPAHKLLLRGRGRHAVRVALDATLGGLVLGLLAAPALSWAVAQPQAARWLDAAAVPVLAATLGLLLWSELRRGWRFLAWGVAVLSLSGAFGLVARDLPLRALLAVPASPFLPLLSGLFGVAGLLGAFGAGAIPDQDPPRRGGRLGDGRVAAALGVGASAFTLLVPGLTSASAAAWAGLARRDGEARQVVLLSAINSAHLALAIAVLAATGSARTGLAIAVAPASGAAGAGLVSPATCLLLATVLAAGLLAWAASGALDGAYLRAVRRLGDRAASLAGIAVLVLVCALFSGWLGLLLLAGATALGLVPVAAGVRRIHLTGALVVPALLARL